MSADQQAAVLVTAIVVACVSGLVLGTVFVLLAWLDELRRDQLGRRGTGWRLVWVRTEVRREVRP